MIPCLWLGEQNWLRAKVAQSSSVFTGLFMLVPSRLLWKPFIAVFTLVRSFTGVNAFVGYHVGTLHKTFATKSEKLNKNTYSSKFPKSGCLKYKLI